MDERTLRDRIYAGWMGKNIGGTLGGPLEGVMELMDIRGYTQEFSGPIENDDLDLQLVNLHAAAQFGGVVTTQLLQREWLSHVFFQYDEYGHSLTNMRKGLYAPMAGAYNNFFTDCMGSPIRSEIWGMICAGQPELAAYFAMQDACVDHAGGEGMYGEIFFAVLESLAFEHDDIAWLIDTSLGYIPGDCVTYKAVQCLLDSHKKGLCWQDARQLILERYAGDNFTYAPINIAFTLVGLLYGQGFTQRLLLTANCGYDTDCTCATIASIMGILYGSAYIDPQWTQPLGENIIVSEAVKGLDAPKTITQLTDRTLAVREIVLAQYKHAHQLNGFDDALDITKQVVFLPQAAVRGYDLRVALDTEHQHPCIAPNASKKLVFSIENGLDTAYDAVVSLTSDSLAVSPAQALHLQPKHSAALTFTVTAPEKAAPAYPVTMSILRTMQGVDWATERADFVLLPTMDWRMEKDGITAQVHLSTNQLVDTACAAFAAETTLCVPQDANVKIIVCCQAPITLALDGEIVVDCNQWTPFIPAYHRADARKCYKTRLTAGKYSVRITAKNPEKLNFYVVSDAYCADHTNITMQ